MPNVYLYSYSKSFDDIVKREVLSSFIQASFKKHGIM